QRTRSFELVGGKGFEPNGPPRRGERGYGPPADHPLVPPVATSLFACVDGHTSPATSRAPFSRVEAKTKKAFQGIALEGLMLDDCRASRARDPPSRSRVDR